MAIKSGVLVRSIARHACLMMIAGLAGLAILPGTGTASAQLPIKAPVPVQVGSVVPFPHGSTGQWSQIYQVVVAHNGSVLFLDTAVSNLYQWSPGAAAPTLVVGPAPSGQSSNGSTLESAGSFWNSGMALDANDNLYITDRYGSAVHFLRVPYDASSGTWVFSQAANWANAPSVTLNGVPTAITPQAIAINCDSGFPCTLYTSWSNTGEIDKMTIDASGIPGTVVRVIEGMEADASNLAVDHAGNLFFLESAYSSTSGRVTGVREIPANSTLPLVGDATGSLEQKLVRVDPASAGFNFKGMTFDAAGNLYLSSENDNNAYGGLVNLVLMVPNEGTAANPNLVWTDAVEVAPVAAGFSVAIDPRGYLWIPNGNGGSNWAPTGTKAPACNSLAPQNCTTSGIVLWVPGAANLGAAPVGTGGATATVFYSFSQPTTPGSFSYAAPEAKNFTTVTTNPNPDPTVIPAVPPCTAGTAYPAFSSQDTTTAENSWCAFYVKLNPTAAGAVSGELQVLDTNKNIVAGSNVYLSGIGQGSAISVLTPAAARSVATGLQAPKQVAADALGNSYVADATLGVVEMYPYGQGSAVGTAIGTGLTAPTGVAVDGAGDVYIGDSGSVIEIPIINGVLATKQQTTLLTGLGKNLTLAADGAGNVYAADADNKQVVKVSNPQTAFLLQDTGTNVIGTGIKLTGPSAIATDSSDNIYVADGGSLWQLSPSGSENEITSSLHGPVTGLAVDPSGSVFVADESGLAWIPYEASTGGLNVNGAVQVATTLGNAAAPFSVALDGFQNAYVSYGSGSTAGLSQIGAGGSINWGSIVPNLENDQEAQIFNLGNTPLTLSAFSGDVFTGPNAGDYAIGTPFDTPACGAATSIQPGLGCFFDVALTPSNPSGANSATLAVLSNAANAPSVNIALSAQIVPDLRSATTTTIAITPATGVVYPGSVTITVTVAAAKASNGTPSGTLTLYMTGEDVQTVQLSGGVATFKFSNLLGGAKTIRAEYGGAGTAGTPPNFAGSADRTSFTVAPATPALAVAPPTGSSSAVTVWAGNTFISVGTNSAITASVSSSVGTPTGTVSFLQNGQPVDPTQAAISLDANGNAVFATTNLPVGVYTITVAYNGDVNYAPVTSVLPTFHVIIPSAQITATPATTTIKAGTPDQVTLTLKPLVGFNEQVNVECVTASLPKYSECTFDNPEIGVGNGTDPTAPSTIVVTISTNVPVNGGTSTSAKPKAHWKLAGVFSLGLLGLLGYRKRLNRYLSLLFVGLMLGGALMGLSACTNAGYSTPPPAPKVTTPPGTYQVQIITVNPQTGQQNSLTSPQFILTATVQ